MEYSTKIAKIEESKTIAVSAKAASLKKSGNNVISFGVGEPDFPTPELIKKAAGEAMQKNMTGYTSAAGLPELKAAVINKFAADYNFKYTMDEVIISNGGKQVLFNGLAAILNPGDEVIIPKPYWVSYPEIVKLAGGKPVFIETQKANNYKMTAADLTAHINNNTKAIILNSPSNPDGHFYSEAEIAALIDVLKNTELFIISDEIYDKLLYDNQQFVSLVQQYPELKARILVVNGMSKTYAMTGWRVGFGFANADWISNMAKIQSHTTSNVNTIAQYASKIALETDQLTKIIAERRQVFQQRRDLVADYLTEIPGLEFIKPQGAFYYFIDISALLGKKFDDKILNSSLDFADVLLEAVKVAVVPGVAFGMDNFIRISFALNEEDIKQGLTRLADFVEQLYN
ncbi:pyridoxal phosphate-dependent aminotransferase [Halanaerobium salsuginis]|uniref:Aminotransferase n=1 Tax=Halanaerobium salsuginis TaxID=29563 RepID=A0A1I4EUL1_9FIRM|nr:pyridoxal phosphate-dependent aminotransferase [Halanaerobium salsuginis]SFL09388.1 aspartate aminotransferase [Halanaerobium salsuginis]